MEAIKSFFEILEGVLSSPLDSVVNSDEIRKLEHLAENNYSVARIYARALSILSRQGLGNMRSLCGRTNFQVGRVLLTSAYWACHRSQGQVSVYPTLCGTAL